MSVLEIPLLEADSFLTLDVGSDLPEDPHQISKLLDDEKCALKWWTAVAAGYYRAQQIEKASIVARLALESAASKSEDRTATLCFLSALSLQKMRESQLAQKTALYDEALQYAKDALEEAKSNSSSSSNSSESSESSESAKNEAALALGAVYASVGNYESALPLFDAVLERDAQNGFAKLGRARAFYARRNYKLALKLFQELLAARFDLQSSADPRIGIGLCCWHLGDKNKALKAWQRAREVAEQRNDAEKQNAPLGTAHCVLGVWFLNAAYHGPQQSFAQNYTEAISHFQSAYKCGQTAFSALRLAAYLYSRKDMQRVKKLVTQVLGTASKPSQLAEAQFWEARAAHFGNDLPAAHLLYSRAVEAEGTFIKTNSQDANAAAHIGKGVVEYLLGRKAEALFTFENAVKNLKASPDLHFYYGFFAFLMDTDDLRSVARDELEKYIRLAKAANQTVRVQALLALAQLRESEYAASYALLRQAAETLDDAALNTNLACFAFQLKEYEAALSYLQKCPDSKLVQYNTARVQEALGNTEEARKTYKELNDSASNARLLLMDEDPERACTESLRLVSADPRDLELRALCTHLYRRWALSASDKQVAKKAAVGEQDMHKQTLTEINKHDVYTLVCMGNIYLRNAASIPKSRPEDRQRAYGRAAEFFNKSLQLDPKSAYAAQGLAIVFCETRNAAAALPILARCREAIATAQTLVNMAHCHVALGEFKRAAELYVLALSDQENNVESTHTVSNLYSYLANCWTQGSIKTPDLDGMRQAVEWAEKAVAEDSNAYTRFNVGVALVQFGEACLKARKRELVKHETLQLALEYTRKGITALRELHSSEDATFDAEELESRFLKAEASATQLEEAVEDQKVLDLKSAERLERSKQLREAELKRRADEAEAEKKRILEKEQELALERKRLQEQAEEWEAERQREREAAGPEEKKKSKKSRRNDYEQEDDNDVGEYQENDSGSDSDSDAPAKAKGDAEGTEGAEGADAADDAEDAEGAEKNVRRQAVMDDDDYDDEDDDNNDGKEDSKENGNESEKTQTDNNDNDLDELF
ncbi:Ctr9 protein [Starmerella bacillaris]|uniref:Ctr9 protein n=1 Tax=Starmerella bacillaris TaxID=1247836 RepID=A0AAV5RPH5_STABA|nr:Ctr9 protein [Starmerella bacillaris]